MLTTSCPKIFQGPSRGATWFRSKEGSLECIVGGGGHSLGAREEVNSKEDVHMDCEPVGCTAGSKSEHD